MFLRSKDGKFYEIPNDQVAQYLIPADKVAETLRALGAGPAQQVQAYHMPSPSFGPPGPGSGPFGPPGPPMPFGPPPGPSAYFNYNDYRNFWGGW